MVARGRGRVFVGRERGRDGSSWGGGRRGTGADGGAVFLAAVTLAAVGRGAVRTVGGSVGVARRGITTGKEGWERTE